MKPIIMIVQLKVNGTYSTCSDYTLTDEESVYTCLAHDLINKKILKCMYIRSIKRVCNYDGTQDIIVTYDNNVRRIYTIANR